MGILDIANEIISDLAVPDPSVYFSFRNIGGIAADVTVREVHTDEDTITVNPVETGTPISDHVFANPQILEIQCGFSDSTGGYAGYVQAAYQEVLALKATRQTFDVSTGKRAYTSMLFGNITVATDETSEYALMMTARLQQVIITDTDGSGMTQGNQADPQKTAPLVSTGNQSPQPTSGVPIFVQNQAYFQ